MIGMDSPVNGWMASMDSKISEMQEREHESIILGYHPI